MTAAADDIYDYIVENFLFGQADRFPGADASLLMTGVLDSTGVLELVSFLESRFQIQVDDLDLVPENLDSLTRLNEFVGRKQAESRS